MVRCNTKPHQTKWHRQMLIHVYHRVLDLRHHLVRSIESCWAGANDGHSKGSSILSLNLRRICSPLSREVSCVPKWENPPCQYIRTSCADPRSCSFNHRFSLQRRRHNALRLSRNLYREMAITVAMAMSGPSVLTSSLANLKSSPVHI